MYTSINKSEGFEEFYIENLLLYNLRKIWLVSAQPIQRRLMFVLHALTEIAKDTEKNVLFAKLLILYCIWRVGYGRHFKPVILTETAFR